MNSNSDINANSDIITSVRLFRTSPHPCSYKEGQLASTVFVDPELEIQQPLSSKLSEMGYRRSGAHMYRPDCDLCDACISCRVPVARFALKKAHRRIWNKNQDLEVEDCFELNCPDSYQLYKHYINTRHKDGDMYPSTPEQFQSFIQTKTADTRFLKFYLQQQLVAVAVIDVLQHGLSAVYTFFEPDLAKRSLGIYVILWQLQLAQRMQVPYLFLGYWIKDCPKMQYKSNFRPIEMLVDGRWVLLT